MKIEKLKKNHKNKIIFGGLIGLGVTGAITILPSFAKYKVTQEINIANGVVNYKVPDLNMIAMYKSDDGENYAEIEGRMPDSGYIINEEKSYCNLNGSEDTNVILKTVDGNHVIANLIKGDKCYLYFDKYTKPLTIPDIIAANNPKDETPTFSSVATTNDGVYKVNDGMYGDYSYYWRGAVTNNYVKFANKCWRIVRINGDGSIRLIYDGTTCHDNGTKTAESIAKTSQTYNASYDRSEYVGYTYTSESQRPSDNATGTASNLKTQTESWYKTNITDKGYDGKVATGKFCNDRNTASGYTWASQPTSTFYYAAYGRLSSAKTPTLDCPKETGKNDIYNLKAGAITADEVAFAGGVVGTANKSYYLYNGQYYWTMSPFRWLGGTGAAVFIVGTDGRLNGTDVYSTTVGVRPVINLVSGTQFKSGTDGTLNNPYEVLQTDKF